MNKRTKEEELEKEYAELEKALEWEEEHQEPIDNLSQHSCSACGARLTKAEWEEYEDTCTQCMWEDTSGIIDDNPEEELD